MSTKVLFHTPNLIDAATLIPSSEDPNFPVENLQDEQRSITYKSLSVTDMNIVISHGTAVPVDTFIVFDHNIPSSGTITFERHTSNFWEGPDFQQVATWNAGPIILRFSPNTKAFSRLRIQVPASQVIEIGRPILCAAKTPEKNFQYGWANRDIDLSDVVEGREGQRFANLKQFIVERDIRFIHRRSDIELLRSFFRDVGISKHLAVSFNHDGAPNTELFYGVFITQLEYLAQLSERNHVSTITFRETT